jgi:undecaprenyl-diphosphatase
MKPVSKSIYRRIIFLSCLFLVTAYLVMDDWIMPFDQAMFQMIRTYRNGIFTESMVLVTQASSGYCEIFVAIITVSGLLIFQRKKAEAVLVIFTLASTWGINALLKVGFMRPRPDIHRLVEASGYSFPSGHVELV